MDNDLQQTLLQLFQQVSNNPDNMPAVPVDSWQQGSVGWQLLSGFRNVLDRFQQSRQEAKQAEAQLHEKENQYRSIFEASTDGLLISDLQGEHIVEANPAMCEMNGYTREELLALPPAHLLAPEHYHLVAESLQTIKEGGQFYNQSVALRKDGTMFHAESRETTFLYKGKPHILTISRDITERVQVAEQLREKEAEYRSVFEASTDGLVINDLEAGHLVEVNPAMYTMHGYSYEEFMALHPMAFISPASHSLFAEYLDTVKAGHLFHARAIDIRKDGTPFPVEIHGTTFAYKGKPHVLAVVRDITEQERAEQELREKEMQYRSIFEASTDGIIIANLDGYPVEVNPAACKMHGYSYEEFINLHPTTFIHPDFYHLTTEHLQSIRTGNQLQSRGILLRKDGSPFLVEAHTTPFIYKGQPHILSVNRDITEQVQAEEQLREKEAQYRSIFEVTSDGIIIISLDSGRIVEANPAACTIYGYDYTAFIGSPATITSHPDDLPFIMENVLPIIKAGGEFRTQAVGLRKDGTPFQFDVHDTAFTYQGKPHILAVVRDITEQVQAQQLLERRVEERTRELSILLEVSHNVASTIELKPLLGLVLDQLKVVADYTGSSFSIVEGEDLVLVDNRGPAPLEQALQLHFSIKRMGIIWEMFCRQEPVIIADVHDDTLLAQAFRRWMGNLMGTTFSYIRAWMGVPLMHKEQVIGMLTLSSQSPNYYTSRHATLTLAIANQAAVALENARLYKQAQDLAALEERQRLARELHDSVSQALYGITLGTHTARTLLDRDPSKVAEPLNYVLSLSEAALAEMRALIFELRPESLETEGLITSLTKQGTALQARHGITVSLALCNEPDLPLKIKQELHRVTQEALHNIVKHASASIVTLRLSCDTAGITLEVRDNGRGFDTGGSFPGHLGLRSMHERMGRLGGKLQIESQPGTGTSIRAWIPITFP